MKEKKEKKIQMCVGRNREIYNERKKTEMNI